MKNNRGQSAKRKAVAKPNKRAVGEKNKTCGWTRGKKKEKVLSD